MTSHCPTCGGRSSLVEEESFDWDDIHVAPGTRHYGLLTSNEVPLDTEFLAVQSVIAKTDARLMFLDTEISRLRDRLQQLKDERIAVSNFRLQNNAILSPLRRIPPEVLAEIFAWTLPSADEIVATDRCGFDIGRSPWVLGHISRQWRAVSLSTPCLWSLVVIDYSFSTWYPLPFLEAQIARARNLEIHFYGCQDSDSRPQITFFQTLVERSSIWKELKIGLTSDLVPHLTTLRNRIPLLRSLWIEWDDPESQTAADLIDAFHTAPSLLDASIWNQHRFISIPLPFHQLTQYDFDGSWATHESILKTAPNLVEARITIAFDEQPWPEQDDIIALLYLRRLYVSDSDVLVYLRTPILQEIVFFSREDDPDPLPHLEPFIIRSRCNLARICFRGSPEAQEVIAILEKYPSITELAIITECPSHSDLNAVCEATSTLISHLTIPNATGNVLVAPQLSTIDFGCEEETYIDHTLYLKMLESRWRADNSSLKRAALVVEEGPGLNAEILDGLLSLRRDGLDLLLLSGSEGTDAISRWIYTTNWI